MHCCLQNDCSCMLKQSSQHHLREWSGWRSVNVSRPLTECPVPGTGCSIQLLPAGDGCKHRTPAVHAQDPGMPITPVSGGSRSLILYICTSFQTCWPMPLMPLTHQPVTPGAWQTSASVAFSVSCRRPQGPMTTRMMRHAPCMLHPCQAASGQGRRYWSDKSCLHAAASKLSFQRT